MATETTSENKVLKLSPVKFTGSDDTEATYAVTTYENTHGIERFLGIFKGRSADIKTAAAGRFNLSKKNIDLLPIDGENFKTLWIAIKS